MEFLIYHFSWQDTFTRSVGFFQSTIEPRLKEGRNVFLVAHGNVLRCLISHLAGLSDLEMLRLQVTCEMHLIIFRNNSLLNLAVRPNTYFLQNAFLCGACFSISGMNYFLYQSLVCSSFYADIDCLAICIHLQWQRICRVLYSSPTRWSKPPHWQYATWNLICFEKRRDGLLDMIDWPFLLPSTSTF